VADTFKLEVNHGDEMGRRRAVGPASFMPLKGTPSYPVPQYPVRQCI